METANDLYKTGIGFINDKSPILDLICKDLIASGSNVLFRSENIEEGLSQLSALQEHPKACVIDLNSWDRNKLKQLQELKSKYPDIKLIVHSDKDCEKEVKALLEIGIESYLLIGSGTDDVKTAIEGAVNNKRYFSVGVSKIACEYFSGK